MTPQPPWYAPVAGATLAIVLATIGMCLWLRRLGLPSPTWPVAALVYISGGLMLAGINTPLARTVAIVPLFAWALELVARKRSWWNVLWVAAMTALLFLGGVPWLFLLIVFAGIAYVITRARRVGRTIRLDEADRRTPRNAIPGTLLRALAGVVLGLLMVGYQLWPLGYYALVTRDPLGAIWGPGGRPTWRELGAIVLPDLLAGPGRASWQTTALFPLLGWNPPPILPLMRGIAALAIILRLLSAKSVPSRHSPYAPSRTALRTVR